MSGKYVRVNDVMELINTPNRGSCDYFIVDQIEKLCKSEKIYDVDKVVEQLQQQAEQYHNRAERYAVLGLTREVEHMAGKAASYEHAIEIVKGGGIK